MKTGDPEWIILEKLKRGLCEARAKAQTKASSLNEDSFGSERWKNSDKRTFYLRDYKDNLFDPKDKSAALGTGKEAVRSSAAMIYNVLGEAEITLQDQAGRFSNSFLPAQYEVPFPTLCQKTTGRRNKSFARLDAELVSKDGQEYLYIEAKLLEWMNSPKNLRAAYMKAENYMDKLSKETKEFFRNFFCELTVKKEKTTTCLVHKYRRYDSIQMALHCLGICNHFHDLLNRGQKTPSKVRLLNVVWSPNLASATDEMCLMFAEEKREATEFQDKANAKLQRVFKSELGIDFSIDYMTLQDFVRAIVGMDPRRNEYLRMRYFDLQ